MDIFSDRASLQGWSLRGLNTDLGHGSVSTAKIFEHSETVEKRVRSEKENDTLRTKIVGWQV